MKNYLLPIFALLIVGCGNQRPRQTYDEMLNDIVQNFNTGTTGGDSVLNAFVRKTQADSVARQYSNPAIKEEMMFNLISDYLVAGQVDNAQHLYDNMLEYAESEYGKVCQMKATVYFEKAHLYEQTGDLDNAIKMMQKSAEVFEKLPKNECNQYNDAKEFIKRWTSDNPIIEFKDPKFLEALLSNYGLDRNGDGQISKREAANVKYLHIDKYAITSMGVICYFTALKKLYCYNNQLTSLDLSKNSELTYLNCRYNQLTSLDISKNTALTYLSCDTNQLISLDLSTNTALTELNCFNNQLSSLNVSKNTTLTELNCYNNQLTSLDVSKNKALTRLECGYNQLISLDLSKNTALTYLSCDTNQLTSLNLSKNTALITLYCGGNQLTSLDVSNSKELTLLRCNGNQLTSVRIYKYNIMDEWLMDDIIFDYGNIITYIE